MNLFTNHTQEDHRKALADFLPQGQSFGSKNIEGKNMFRLLFGFAAEMQRTENLMNLIYSEYDPRTTTLLIDEWEGMVGIPDGCFSKNDTLENRRLHVVIKLTLSADTRQSFINLANALGFQCEINSGGTFGIYPLPYPWMYFGTVKEANFTMFVDLDAAKAPSVYPFTIPKYPWPYTSGVASIVECLFDVIGMASVKIIFRYIL